MDRFTYSIAGPFDPSLRAAPEPMGTSSHSEIKDEDIRAVVGLAYDELQQRQGFHLANPYHLSTCSIHCLSSTPVSHSRCNNGFAFAREI